MQFRLGQNPCSNAVRCTAPTTIVNPRSTHFAAAVLEKKNYLNLRRVSSAPRSAVRSRAWGAISRTRSTVTCSVQSTEPATGRTSYMEYLTQKPQEDEGESQTAEVMLVILPGFGVPLSSMSRLAAAVQEQCKELRLWVSTISLDFMALSKEYVKPGMTQIEMTQAIADAGVVAKALDEVVARAKEEGFKANDLGWGRYSNVFMMAHSLSGPICSAAAFKKAAGYILLASTFNADYLLHRFTSLESWGSRPVLLVGGELDGQMRWPWSATQAFDSAVLAQMAGPNFAAAFKPYVLIPGANHAQSTQDPINSARGDVAATAPDAEALAGFGRTIACFLAAHGAGEEARRQAAATELLQASRTTAEMIGPYFMANGMGDICEAWVTGSGPGKSGGFSPEAQASIDYPDLHTHQHHHQQQQPRTNSSSSNSSSSLGGGLLQGTMRQVDSGVSSAVHPGVVAKAQRFAAAAQLQLVSSLPKEIRSMLRVVVTVHTDMEGFLYNQPLLQVEADGHLVVLVHVRLQYNSCDPHLRGMITLKPVAPEYWLKLKRPQAIAEELGLSGTFADGLTAQQLLHTTIEAATAAVPPATAARYTSRGHRLRAQEDQLQPDINAEKFLRESKLVFQKQRTDGGAGGAPAAAAAVAAEGGGGPAAGGGGGDGEGGGRVVAVTAPRLVTPSVSEAKAAGVPVKEGDVYSKRFLGNWYVKVMSVAQAMEWVMLDCLREDTPWP